MRFQARSSSREWTVHGLSPSGASTATAGTASPARQLAVVSNACPLRTELSAASSSSPGATNKPRVRIDINFQRSRINFIGFAQETREFLPLFNVWRQEQRVEVKSGGI